jgi:hypothetical protein
MWAMWRRVWDMAGCTTLAWLAVSACGKADRSPGDESGGSTAATAGSAKGGGGGSGSGSGGGSSGGSSGGSGSGSSGSGGTAGAAVGTAGQQAASGGASGTGGGTPLGGTEGALGGGPSTAEAGASTAGGASGCNRSYHACGCGCCTTQTTQSCVYPGVGPSFDELVAADIARRNDTAGCATAGCSLGQDYLCCEAPPLEDEGATYEANVYIGGVDRLRLYKRGAVNCSTFALMGPKRGGQAFPIELPLDSDWELDQITRLPCISSAIGPRAIGAIGKFNIRVSGDACVVDAHVTAFFADAQGVVDAERFDAEGVPVNLSLAFCK